MIKYFYPISKKPVEYSFTFVSVASLALTCVSDYMSTREQGDCLKGKVVIQKTNNFNIYSEYLTVDGATVISTSSNSSTLGIVGVA